METTGIRINEDGDEAHESWIRVGASKVQGTSHWLFDSDIPHQHWVSVRVERCTRKRELNRDWLYNTQILMEFSMSEAQWGAFVSSFGSGGGVPATLEFLNGVGHVPQAPPESRLDESHAEVRDAAEGGVKKVSEAFAAYKAHKTAANLRTLEFAIKNLPSTLEFAATSLTEHVENVVTKMRGDIEGMVLQAIENGELPEGSVQSLLGKGDE